MVMIMEAYIRKIKDEELADIFSMIDDIKSDLVIQSRKPLEHIYSTKDMLNVLGVTDKTLARYRNDGLLRCHRYDDKYWYTQADLDAFMSAGRVCA